MNRSVTCCLFAVCLASAPALGATVGTSAQFPGFSGLDIRLRTPGAINGVYWIDPDLPGGNAPFQVYVDNTVQGGGWTLAHDRNNLLPDMDAQSSAISTLAVSQPASIRLVSGSLDALFLGNYYQTLPLTGWTVLSGNPALLPSLLGRPWGAIDFNQYTVFVRETNTLAYPEIVPLPAAALLLVSGLAAMGIGVVGRRRVAPKVAR